MDAAVAAVPASAVPTPTTDDPRARRMIDELRLVIRDLEGGATPERAFAQIDALERVVGPPTIVLPPIDLTCSTEADCALTGRRIVDDSYRCCPSLFYTAGTVQWTRDLERTCGTYEALRGGGAMQLPGCGIVSGPISANAAHCRARRCIACLEPTDGGAPYCEP